MSTSGVDHDKPSSWERASQVCGSTRFGSYAHAPGAELRAHRLEAKASSTPLFSATIAGNRTGCWYGATEWKTSRSITIQLLEAIGAGTALPPHSQPPPQCFVLVMEMKQR